MDDSRIDDEDNLRRLNELLASNVAKYQSCVRVVEKQIDLSKTNFKSPPTTVRLHHLAFDSQGEPKFRDLAEVLADHLIYYCFHTSEIRRSARPDHYIKLDREARAMLRRIKKSGEAGELLLFLLIECVLKAPALVARLSLKTNPKNELNGSDGVHGRWNEKHQRVDLFFGEAKLEKEFKDAVRRAFVSTCDFYRDGLDKHEIGLVTSRFRSSNPELRESIRRFIDRKEPSYNCRIHHAILLGYSWGEYKRTKFRETLGDMHSAFEGAYYKEYLDRLRPMLERRLQGSRSLKIRFEVFILPFPSVQGFRDSFFEIVAPGETIP